MAGDFVGRTIACCRRRPCPCPHRRDGPAGAFALPAATDRRGPFRLCPPKGLDADDTSAASGRRRDQGSRPTARRNRLVHGDVWPGNLLWAGDEVAALIDWKTAGVGAPGVDVSELRKQVAIIVGPEAPDLVLEGWERATGTKAQDVSYWDAVAALNTRTELDDGYRSGGWAPLPDAAGATDRRDAFLRVALANLGS
jgi:Phosphotransferase enzyme family